MLTFKLNPTNKVSDKKENKKLKVLLASAEVAPFSKVGGLADVVGELPRFLKKKGLKLQSLHRCTDVLTKKNGE